ncbi:MAG: HlyD family efflux transporter periplasmic adaptor subunit [Dehalococcoidales bacterium]|nr:HlyD family efflux transporter periplasmic adaptor subunit [Dehalococcoidales bacterium]
MRRAFLGIGAIVVVAVVGWVTIGGGLAGFGGAPQAEPTPPPVVQGSNEVVADAHVVPVKSAALSVATGGVVAKILVAEGDEVTAGQVLLQLDSAKQQVAVTQAEAGVKRAQAALAQLRAGPQAPEIAAAKAAVEAAQGQLARVQQGPRSDEVAAAEAAVTAAESALQKVLEGPEESQVIMAKADLANAEAALKQAQGNYDKVAAEPNIGARPEALALEQATNNYYAAQSRLDALLAQPTDAAVATAKAQVEQAQASLARVKAGAQPGDLAAASATVRQAQAQLELVQAGARPEAIAAAEADVATAQAAVEQAKVALADTELKAPFAGTVAAVDVTAGEQVGPASPVIQLADFSVWQIETTDLTELDVVDIREGDAASVTFDAIPDLELAGKVSRIKSLGENKQGDITYTVVVKPDQQDERLRWNMTATVSIKPKQ